MNVALCRLLLLFGIAATLVEAAILAGNRPMLFTADDDALKEGSALPSTLRPKRSFDRLDSSPFGFSASVRAIMDGEPPILPRAVEEHPPLFRPRKRLFYHLSDGYLFGRR
ncbi:hypothetical protein AAVH_11843 [Aphelenchoides avenae]|nr:hypothetical protein AAVH_11843 [Aphelenchus avenae]